MDDLTTRLQLRQLKLLSEIGNSGQLSLAAERLSITQPGASRTLAEIETIVGRPVFDRTPKGMTVTPMGAILVSHANLMVNALNALARDAENFERGTEGALRIGSVTGAAVAFVVPAVQALQETSTTADIQLTVGPSSALVDGLLRGEFDYILSRIPETCDPRSIDVLRGRVENVRFMMRGGHPLAGHPELALRNLEGFNWVIQSVGTPMRQAVQGAFVNHNMSLPRKIINTSSLLVMIAYLQSSDFISPVSSEVADLVQMTGTGGMTTIKTREDIIIAPYHLIQRKDFKPTPLGQRFRKILLQNLRA